MTSLFPDHPTGFHAKCEDGVLAKYCRNCDQHLDRHGTMWRTAEGSERVCPRPDQLLPTDVPSPARRAAEARAAEAAAAAEAASHCANDGSGPFVDPPFGTDLNATAIRARATRGPGAARPEAKIQQSGLDDGSEAPVETQQQRRTRKVVSPPVANTSLAGAGIQSSFDEREVKRPSVPCRRSNDSQSRGAAVLPQ